MHRIAIAVAVVIACARAAEPAPLAGGALDALERGGGWRDAETVDGRACRALVGGGTVRVAAWWKDGARPPDGAAYRVEIVFRDDATAPIRVEAFAGLPGRYELERIGGLGDGAWRAALVPLPWDLVMRVPGGDRVEIALNVPGDKPVPFASLRVVAGDAVADEARWSAETRAWIARVQASARANAVLPPAETAAIPEALRAQPLVAYARAVGEVAASSAPQAGECGADGLRLRLTLARNEYGSSPFALYANGADAADVEVSVADGGLKRADGVALDAECRVLAAELSLVPGEGDKPRLVPLRLWPAYALDIPADRSHPYLLEVACDRGHAQPGVYAGALVVRAKGVAATTVPVTVEIADLALLTMEEAGLTMGGCTDNLLPAHEVVALARQNHNSIQLWYSTVAPGLVRHSETEFDLDCGVLDDFMRRAYASGMRRFVWFLGGDPYGFPDTCHLERELWRQVYRAGGTMEQRKEYLRAVTAAPDQVLPPIRALYRDWTRKLVAHARDAGWPEPILTPYDEPAKWTQKQNSAKIVDWKQPDGYEHIDHPRRDDIAKLLARLDGDKIPYEVLGTGGAGTWIKPHFQDSCALMREGDPQVKIYASIHHHRDGMPFLAGVDVFCTNAIRGDPTLGDQVRAVPNKVFWQYSGIGDQLGTRWTFGFFFARSDSRGSLCWAYNAAGDRWDASRGEAWMYGWTTPYGQLRSFGGDAMREAWNDRRYLETLRARARAAGQAAAVEDFLRERLAALAAVEGDAAALTAGIAGLRAAIRERIVALR